MLIVAVETEHVVQFATLADVFLDLESAEHHFGNASVLVIQVMMWLTLVTLPIFQI